MEFRDRWELAKPMALTLMTFVGTYILDASVKIMIM